MIVYEIRKGKSENCYVSKTVMMCSLQTLASICFPGLSVINWKKNKIKQSLDCSQETFDALKACVCVEDLLLLQLYKQQVFIQQQGVEQSNTWRQRRRIYGKLSKSARWNGKCNFYKSWISHKEHCGNLHAEREKTFFFILSKSWKHMGSILFRLMFKFIEMRSLFKFILSNLPS